MALWNLSNPLYSCPLTSSQIRSDHIRSFLFQSDPITSDPFLFPYCIVRGVITQLTFHYTLSPQ